MMVFPKQFLRQMLGLMVAVAMLCGSMARASGDCAGDVHSDDEPCDLATMVEHNHDHGGHADPCDESSDESCPDIPHHHHDDACWHSVGHFAARIAAVTSMTHPAQGRAGVDWIDMNCDLEAVRELDTPPII